MIETLMRPAFTKPGGWPPAGVVRFVDVPERRVLMIDGAGEPSGPGFQGAIGALYGTAYTLKFALKRRQIETKVGCLEALWSRPGEAPDVPFTELADPTAWIWTAIMAVPDEATDDDVMSAIEGAAKRRPGPAFGMLRLERWREGKVVEALHVGPYATEPETIARMLAAAAAAGLHPTGVHHEIYLGDPNRSAPEKLRTILRQPVG